MKKKMALIIAIILTFSLASCVKNTDANTFAPSEEIPTGQQETEETMAQLESTESQPNQPESIEFQPNSTTNSTSQGNNATTPNSTTEVLYGNISSMWYPHKNAEELVESADAVIIGKVSGISFQILDATTGMPPDEKTEERHRRLWTIYDINILTAYKGSESSSLKIKTDGGLKDYRVEEQLELIKDLTPPNNIIAVSGETSMIKMGETYLFTLSQSRNWEFFNVMTPSQSIHNLKNPFGKGEAVASQENQRGSSTITAKDVISVFGQDKWDAFWAQWQKDNPGWESRLDKAAVEKALAAN
ncbi:MAG: hypothetical protein FWF05_03405 [Oscillospiraceae bacterium]|nr:hypothetical protein [Oscillospiraceae bacterium]